MCGAHKDLQTPCNNSATTPLPPTWIRGPQVENHWYINVILTDLVIGRIACYINLMFVQISMCSSKKAKILYRKCSNYITLGLQISSH